MAKSLVLGPLLARFDAKLVHKNIFVGCCCKLSLYAFMHFQGKLISKTWENGKKSSFGINFGPFGPNLVPKYFLWVLPLLDVMDCSKRSLYGISRKTNPQNLRKWQKTLFRNWFCTFGPNLGPKNFLREFHRY